MTLSGHVHPFHPLSHGLWISKIHQSKGYHFYFCWLRQRLQKFFLLVRDAVYYGPEPAPVCLQNAMLRPEIKIRMFFLRWSIFSSSAPIIAIIRWHLLVLYSFLCLVVYVTSFIPLISQSWLNRIIIFLILRIIKSNHDHCLPKVEMNRGSRVKEG